MLKKSKIFVTIVSLKIGFSRSFLLLDHLDHRKVTPAERTDIVNDVNGTRRPINNVDEYIPLRTRYVFLRGRHRDPSSISINVNDDERARARDAFYRQSALTRAK